MSRARARVGLVLAAVGAAVVTGGCVLGPASLDGPIAIELHIDPKPTSIGVDAPTWYARTSDLYLCPADPPPLPEPGPARVGWTPGRLCHAFPRVTGGNGLDIALPLDDLSEAERDVFAAAPDWYLLITDVASDDRVTSAIRSRFPQPDGFAT